MVGDYDGTIAIGSNVLQGRALFAALASFVAEYDTNGNVLWVTPLDGEYSHVAVGMDGRVAVLGRFTGTLQFPNAPVTSESDAMVFAALDANGAVLWGGHDADRRVRGREGT